MRKSIIISLIALLISITALLVALIAYFKRRSCALCDDLDDDLLECFDEDDCCDCCGDDCETGEEDAPEDEAPAAGDGE